MIQRDEIILRDKDFYWISVLDGDWGVTEKTPLKFICCNGQGMIL